MNNLHRSTNVERALPCKNKESKMLDIISFVGGLGAIIWVFMSMPGGL